MALSGLTDFLGSQTAKAYKMRENNFLGLGKVGIYPARDKIMMKSLFLFIFLVFSLQANSAQIKAEISFLGDTTHIEFSGAEHWDYNLKKDKNRVEILVPAIQENSIKNLESFKSADVQSIKVDQQGPDGKNILIINLNKGDMEAFDYLTDQPSRLVVDIYSSKASKDEAASPKSEAKSAEKKSAEAKKSDATTALSALPGASRKPAAVDVLVINKDAPLEVTAEPEKKSGIFDGADPRFDRFSISDYEVKEESIIASKENIYLSFPALRIQSLELQKINLLKPIYEITPKDSEENKQARLLLTLYNNKRYNVFLKTVEWFNEKFPNSEYDEIIRFMRADAHFALWLDKRNVSEFDLSMLRYRQALEKYPQSPLVERTLMLMGYATLDRGDYLGTLRMFQSHLRTRPQSKNRDLARLGVAEAYLKLSRFEEAVNQYREIEKDGFTEEAKVQATFMAGDVYFVRKDYEKAVEEYRNAINRLPVKANDFPNAFYNQAAAQFELKKYRDSLDLFKEFIKKFPNHPYAGYAMTRIGELLDILGADKSRVVGAYLETFFRYGDSPSAVVSRLRLLSLRMKDMKPKELEHAVEEIGKIAKASEIPQIEQFATLMIAEGYHQRKDYDKAIDLLVKYYQANPTNADTALLSKKIILNISTKINDLVESNQFIEALKTHNTYADNWLKNSTRIDLKFDIGRSFELAGVQSEAEALYKDSLNKVYALKGTTAGKERSVIEKLPSEDKLNLRLAAVSVAQGKHSLAYEYLKNIKDPEKLSEKEQVERVELAATLLEQKGDLDSASRYLVELIKTWKGQPEIVAGTYLHLSNIEYKQKKIDESIKSLQKIDDLMQDSQKVPVDIHATALEKMANYHLERGNADLALKSYQDLLEKYESIKPLASIRYNAGKIYFDKGEIQKAADYWKDLKNEKNDFWYKLSQEKLKNSDWNNEYKKYIQRIPAMSEKENK